MKQNTKRSPLSQKLHKALSPILCLLAVIGFVFVCEALSVIIQVISFQTTGKRVFRMSPIHHHFELGGWSEWKVVTVFWCVGLIASVAGLSLAAH